jgi:hypothetical protein
MELKGKVSAVRKGWSSMYPTMPNDEGGKPEVEVELAGGGSLRFPVDAKQAKDYRLGDDLVVEVVAAAKDAAESETVEE